MCNFYNSITFSHIYGVQITGKCIFHSIFNMHPGKTLYQVLTITPQADGNFSSSPRCFSENVPPPPPQLNGGGYTNFVNLHILCLC